MRCGGLVLASGWSGERICIRLLEAILQRLEGRCVEQLCLAFAPEQG